MYYEATKLKRHEVPTVSEAIWAKGDQFVLPPSVQPWEAITFEISGITVYLVSDVHIDDPDWAEVAIIIEYQGHKAQIESYTGRALGVDQLYEVIADYFMDEYDITKCEAAQLNFELKGDEMAQFTCSCCGNWFTGNVKEQAAHGQDRGYGLCDDCDENFHL
jgi:hypothetical protein